MTEQIQLEIPLILPEIPDATDACVHRLTANLSARPGIEKAHIVPAQDAKPASVSGAFSTPTLPTPSSNGIASRMPRSVQSVSFTPPCAASKLVCAAKSPMPFRKSTQAAAVAGSL